MTYARLVTIANSGHDRFVPGLTRDEARDLVTSTREHFAAELAAANEALERVRALTHTPDPDSKAFISVNAIRAALASQPEAPCSELEATQESLEAALESSDKYCERADALEQLLRDARENLNAMTITGKACERDIDAFLGAKR